MFTVSDTFSGEKSWNIYGEYFRLLDTVNPVDVVLYDQAGRVGEARQVEGGFFQRLTGRPYSRVSITTGGSEAVKFIYGSGEGGYDRLFASVTVSDVLIDSGDVLAQAVVAVGAAATAIVAQNVARGGLVLVNESSDVVYVGSSGVALSSGHPLAPGERWVSPFPRAAHYGIASGAGRNVRYLEAT